MQKIALFTGYTKPSPSPGFAGHGKKRKTAAQAKFVRVAAECNKKGSKTARKECFRKHYPR